MKMKILYMYIKFKGQVVTTHPSVTKQQEQGTGWVDQEPWWLSGIVWAALGQVSTSTCRTSEKLHSYGIFELVFVPLYEKLQES